MSVDQEIIYELKRRHTTDPWGFKITTLDGNKTYITDIFENTPAFKAGVQINEIILSINQVPCGEFAYIFNLNVLSSICEYFTAAYPN